MAKYAIIWTTSKGYMPGTNASLNALELYGFDIDVFVMLWDELDKEYLNQWPNINFVKMVPVEGKSNFWNFVFSDLKFAIDNLFKNYKVVLFWGGDLCIVDNFMDYFEVADKLDSLILGVNEHHGEGLLTHLTLQQPYKHTWSVPYADVPFFVPNTKTKVIQNILDYQNHPQAELSRMDGLNYSVRDENEKVFTVPGHLWVMNAPQWGKVKRSGNNLLLFGSKMKSFHRKYWNKNYASKYAKGNNTSKHNVTVFNHMYQMLNNQRVKWTEGIDSWESGSDL